MQVISTYLPPIPRSEPASGLLIPWKMAETIIGGDGSPSRPTSLDARLGKTSAIAHREWVQPNVCKRHFWHI